MEYTEFLEKIVNSSFSVATYCDMQYKLHSRVRDVEEYDDIDIFAIYKDEWVGGYSGGSCWGGKAEYERDESAVRNVHTEFNDALDSFFSTFCPNISYLQYRKVATLINEAEISHSEYYGNTNETLTIYIETKKLYDAFREMELV